MTVEKIGIERKRILISGASGFVGANICRALLERGGDIHALIRPNSNLWRINIIQPEINIYPCDMTDFVALKRNVSTIDPDFIIHCAAQGITDQSLLPGDILSNNVLMTQNLLEATRDIQYLGFIHIGSSTEYGPREIPLKEDMILKPATIFGISKSTSTLLSQREALTVGKPVIIMRLFSVFGYWENGHRLIPNTILSVLNNREILLTKPGVCRDFIFIEDVMESLLKVFDSNAWGGEILNIGTGTQWSNEEIVDKIFSVCQKRVPISSDIFPPRPHDTSFWVADIEKATGMLNWQPQNSIEKGLEKTVQWFYTHHREYQ